MRILVVTWIVDAGILSIENVIREMLRRGHHVEIYACALRRKHTWMFDELGIPIQSVDRLTDEIVKGFDIAFTEDSGMRKLRLYDIYTFSFNYIPDTTVTEGSDFMFTMVNDRKLVLYEDCATMPIGSTKNDAPKALKPSEKQFLYIDGGHNPFGETAKKRVAEMLLSICKRFPDYKIVIKPRWFLEELEDSPHLSRIHIYEVLLKLTDNHLPENLVFTYEYRNLQEMIDESECVITTSVSCYLDVALRSKGCIVVTGLGSEEQYDSRSSLENAYRDAEDSGCCVNYKDVSDYLPEGIRCREDHLNKRIAYRDNVSSKILDVMEYIYNKCVKKGKYPSIKTYDFETFKEEIDKNEYISLDDLKRRRFKNGTLILMRPYSWLRGVSIDLSPWTEKLEKYYRSFSLTEDGFKKLHSLMEHERRILFVRNREKLMHDPINQSLLLEAMFYTDKSEIMMMEKEDILCWGPYCYYLGCIYSKNNLSKKAIYFYKEYLLEAGKRSYKKYWQDEANELKKAFSYVFSRYNRNNLLLEEIATLCIILHLQGRETIEAVDYRARNRMRKILPEIASKLEKTNLDLSKQVIRIFNETEGYYNARNIDSIIDFNRKTNIRDLELINKKRGGFIIRKLLMKKSKENRNNTKGVMESDFIKIYDIFKNKVLAGFSIYEKAIRRCGVKAKLYLSAHSRGDTYILGGYYNEFIKKENGVNPVFVTWQYAGNEVADLFSIRNIMCISGNEFRDLYNLLMFNNGGFFNIWSLHYHAFYRHTAIAGYLMGINGLNLKALSAAALNVDEGAWVKPKYEYKKELLNGLFQSYGLKKGRTIVLAPYAKSVYMLQDSFWINLAKAFKKAGYTVCTNVTADEKAVAGTKGIFIPFNMSVAFIENAGVAIGLRSGFQDVTSTANCLKISLVWNNNPNPYVYCSNYRAFNLRDMYGENNQFDYVYSDDAEEELIDKILLKVRDFIEKANQN